MLQAYRELMPGASPQEVWSALATDAAFRMPAIRLATAQHEHGPVWMYRFTWETPVFGGVLRSTHTLEIPFVFDTLHQPGADQFTGAGPERAGRRRDAPGVDRLRRGPAIRAGPSTSRAGGRRCGSTARPGSSTTPTRGSAGPGSRPAPD